MYAYALLFIIVTMNFSFGLFVGYAMSQMFFKNKTQTDEKTIYCHGFEDGVYNTLGEYNPEYFKVEMAENCFKEYKAIKYGPEKH